MFPDGPHLDYLPPSLPPPPPPPSNGPAEAEEEEDHLEDDVISIDESNRGLVIDESTHDEVPPSPVDSRLSSPGLPSPLAEDVEDGVDAERVNLSSNTTAESQPRYGGNRRDRTLLHHRAIDDNDDRLQFRASGEYDATTDVDVGDVESRKQTSIARAVFPGAAASRTHHSPAAVASVQEEKVVAVAATSRAPSPDAPSVQTRDKITTTKASVTTKSYFCDFCQKSFVWKKSFDHHMKVHSGVREFHCSHSNCQRSFSLKKQLVRHLKSHHKAQSRFACPSCGKTFLLEGDLLTHLDSHVPKKTLKGLWVCGFVCGGQNAN